MCVSAQKWFLLFIRADNKLKLATGRSLSKMKRTNEGKRTKTNYRSETEEVRVHDAVMRFCARARAFCRDTGVTWDGRPRHPFRIVCACGRMSPLFRISHKTINFGLLVRSHGPWMAINFIRKRIKNEHDLWCDRWSFLIIVTGWKKIEKKILRPCVRIQWIHNGNRESIVRQFLRKQSKRTDALQFNKNQFTEE